MTIYQHEAKAEREAPAQRRPGPPPRVSKDPADFKAQYAYLSRRGLDPNLALFNGWYPSRAAGDAALRVVIPASPAALGFWQARAVAPDVEKRYQSPHADRGSAVIVVFPVGPPHTLVVVEGPMDALAAAGIPDHVGVSVMGNTPPAVCFDYVASQWPGIETLVVPDRDAPEAGARWLAELAARDLPSRLVLLPSKDLAALAPEDRREALR